MRGPPRTKPHPTWPYWEASASWFMALHEYEPDGIICLMEEPQLRLLNKVSPERGTSAGRHSLLVDWLK